MSTLLTHQIRPLPPSVTEADLVRVIRLLDEALDVFKGYEGGRSSALDIRARSMVMAVRDELLAEAVDLHVAARH